MTQELKYPPLPKADMLSFTMGDMYSGDQMRSYADAALALQAALHAEELLAYELTVSKRDAEIARMRTELHQHECNNFEAVREQRDFLLASQTLLIESAKAGQDAQAAEIDRLKVDADRLDWLDLRVINGRWLARESVTGRGYRLHTDRDSEHTSTRQAIDAAMKETP